VIGNHIERRREKKMSEDYLKRRFGNFPCLVFTTKADRDKATQKIDAFAGKEPGDVRLIEIKEWQNINHALEEYENIVLNFEKENARLKFAYEELDGWIKREVHDSKSKVLASYGVYLIKADGTKLMHIKESDLQDALNLMACLRRKALDYHNDLRAKEAKLEKAREGFIEILRECCKYPETEYITKTHVCGKEGGLIPCREDTCPLLKTLTALDSEPDTKKEINKVMKATEIVTRIAKKAIKKEDGICPVCNGRKMESGPCPRCGGSEKKKPGSGGAWKQVGARPCPANIPDIPKLFRCGGPNGHTERKLAECSQPVFRRGNSEDYDYGEQGGPGWKSCIENCESMPVVLFLVKALAYGPIDKDGGLYEKVKWLFIQSETCGKCCPCPCRKTCPTEPLFQEIRTELGIPQREDKCQDCSTCEEPKGGVWLSGETKEKLEKWIRSCCINDNCEGCKSMDGCDVLKALAILKDKP
jgi:hypothetical protein